MDADPYIIAACHGFSSAGHDFVLSAPNISSQIFYSCRFNNCPEMLCLIRGDEPYMNASNHHFDSISVVRILCIRNKSNRLVNISVTKYFFCCFPFAYQLLRAFLPVLCWDLKLFDAFLVIMYPRDIQRLNNKRPTSMDCRRLYCWKPLADFSAGSSFFFPKPNKPILSSWYLILTQLDHAVGAETDASFLYGPRAVATMVRISDGAAAQAARSCSSSGVSSR